MTQNFQPSAQSDWTQQFSIKVNEGFFVQVSGQWQWDPHQPAVGGGGTGQTNDDMPVPNAAQGCLLIMSRSQSQIHLPVPGRPPGLPSIPLEKITFMLSDGPQGIPGSFIPWDADVLFRINDDKLDDNVGSLAAYS
jgi:hypothetical protein